MNRNWQDLISPKGIEAESLSQDYGKFIIRPLERGYGLTLGNSLRRVLLSSINGAAVVAVRFEGVSHEFSNLIGVKEDVTDIILNIKQVNIRYEGDESVKISIDKKGLGIVTAGDIITDGSVEILNPDQVIAHIGQDGHLKCEMVVKQGKGYVAADQNRSDDLPVGFIAIDSIFAPVRRVAYNVSNARVGQMTDYDRLSLEVWTSGAVKPEDAVAYAAKILKEQLNVFINFDEAAEPEPVAVQKEEASPSDAFNENLFKTVDSLELTVRASNCLENANIKYIGELVTKSEGEMLKTKNFGRKSLNEIKDILDEMGLSLGMTIEGFDPSTLRDNNN